MGLRFFLPPLLIFQNDPYPLKCFIFVLIILNLCKKKSLLFIVEWKKLKKYYYYY
jgi:hypothetical protein